MAVKSENTPSQSTIKPGETISLSTRFGNLSRGKCWGKCFVGSKKPKGDFVWVEKSGGTLLLTEPGYYVVGSDDGFQRKANGEFYLAPPAAAEVKEEAKKQAAATVEQATADCWTILQALPVKEMAKVVKALKLKVSPPKEKPAVEEPEEAPELTGDEMTNE